MSDANAVVTAFLEELGHPKPRVDELLAFFTDDGVWWDAPPGDSLPYQREARGTDELRAKFAILRDLVEEMVEIRILNQVAAGDVVLSERIDRVRARGHQLIIQICAAFVVRDGKIASWRDYYHSAEPEGD